ncbi:MAG: DUF6439 family protein [Geitlerinemataceae cyanobacterium]
MPHDSDASTVPAASPSGPRATGTSPLWQTKLQDPTLSALADYSPRDLARALLERLSIDERDWHRQKGNRLIRAREQTAAALVFLLADNSEEAAARLSLALDWVERRVKAPPCPDRERRSSAGSSADRPTSQSK